MKEEYTEEKHAHNLLKMLDKKNPCLYCPATPEFSPYIHPMDFWPNNACEICNNFIDLETHNIRSLCPCIYFNNPTLTIKLTWLALEEKGYI